MTVYVLVAVVKKRLSISADLYTILQVLSLALFEKMPIFKLFSNTGYNLSNVESHNQLILPASCITFLSEQAFAPQNTRFWSRRRVWFQFTVGEDKPPMLSVDNRGKGVLSMDCSAKRSPL